MKEKKYFVNNRKAFHNFEILEKFEAGIALNGCEVKSIKNGKANLTDAFAKIFRNELWLMNCHIMPYFEGNISNDEPLRNRKLLMHRREINKLIGKTEEKGLTIIPLSMYLVMGKIKVELGLAKPKKLFDKREDLKKKAIKKEIEYEFKVRNL
ncbi:MAG: SsrA-binding protein SmpB [Candidatus Margulisiibacteriota bacterium]|jgi:SsrA-binding protein